MKSFYINPATGDLEFDGNKSIVMVEGDSELVQCVDITLKTNQGEWMLNPYHGFRRAVTQTRHYDESEVADEIYEAVLQESRIASVDQLSFDYNKQNRQLKVNFVCSKDNGETVEGVI